MNTAKLLFRGAGLRIMTVVISVASSFFLAPFVIHSLGDRWYGLWVLVGSFIGFYGLLDFGISSATQRYLAHALPRRDPDELNTIVAASLAMFCGISLIAVVITLGVVVLAPFFIADPQNLATFRVVSFILGLDFAISLPFYTQHGILAANLRFDYASLIQIGKIILRTALFFFFLSIGYGIVSLAVLSLLVNFCGYAAVTALAHRMAPWLRLRRKHFAYSKMRELIGFGVYTFIGQIAGTIKFRLDNIVIAGTIGLGPVTHFNIATKLNNYFFNALGSLVPSSASVYAGYHARGEIHQIRDKFLILARINTILGMLGAGAVLIFARPFIALWVGPQYLDAFVPLVIIVLGRIPSILQSPAVGVIYAMARQKFTAYVNLGEALVNLALSLLLVHRYGIVGVALGTAIPMVATRVTIQPVYICSIMNLRLWTYIKGVVPPALVAVLAQLPLVYAVDHVALRSYWQIAAWATGYYTPLLAFFYFVMLTPKERQLFAEGMPTLRPKNRKRVMQAQQHRL
jgi:O-antigen/teichoic acid export membrane protein